MQTHSPQKIEEHYGKLPEILKDAMYSPDVASKMVAMGKKFGLSIEKIGLMAEQTGYVVLGLVRPEEFIQALANALGESADKTSEIAKEINSQIFYPLREALKSAHQIEISESALTAPAAVAPAMPPLPKVETALPPLPVPAPAFAKPPGEERKIIPPIDLRSKSALPLEPKFFDKFAAQKMVPPQPTSPPLKVSPPLEEKPLLAKVPQPKPTEPIKPPTIQPKIPPLDLRRVKSERMREAIFAPPIEPQTPAPPKEPPPVAKPPQPQQEKKAPYGGYDPYREQAE